ncbi:MAG: hypothetical protein ACTSWY_11275 [Promethearchaeota archaeon]
MPFKVVTRVSWDSQPQKIDLHGMNELSGSYPIISIKFFSDLVLNIKTQKSYWAESGFQSLIIGDKQYEPHEWIFLAATDFKDRFFQILFSRSVEFRGKGLIAAVAPREFAGFLQQFYVENKGEEAIIATLSLINDPNKMKSVVLFVSSPKEAKKAQTIRNITRKEKQSPELRQFNRWINGLKRAPNIKGQWFPSHKPVCPNCNEQLLGVPNYEIGFVYLICPRCGYQQKRKISK